MTASPKPIPESSSSYKRMRFGIARPVSRLAHPRLQAPAIAFFGNSQTYTVHRRRRSIECKCHRTTHLRPNRTDLRYLRLKLQNRNRGRLHRTDRLPIDRLVEKLICRTPAASAEGSHCLSMISHELRTPLASIQLSHDLLARYSQRVTEEERQEYLDNISQQVAHLNEIVSDVLNLSKSKPRRPGILSGASRPA